MRTAHLLLLALAASGLSGTASAADVWKWVDSKGVTHYSDQPVPGATKIEVRAGNISESRPATSVSSEPEDSDSDADAGDYQTFQIVRPTSNQVIVNTAGQVDVEIRVAPQLKSTHRLTLYLDGKQVTGFGRNATGYALTAVPRGTHNLTAVIADASGNTIQEASAVEFTVRQESIATPPTGPSIGPPPKPPTPRPTNKMPSNKMPSNKLLTKQPSYDALHGGGQLAINPATNLPVEKKPAPKPGKP